MKKKLSLALIISTLALSCAKESISTEANPRGASSQQVAKQRQTASVSTQTIQSLKKQEEQKLYRVRGTYYVDTIEVNAPNDNAGQLVQNFANLLVDIIMKIGGNFEVELDPISIDASEVDTEIVKEAFAKRIRIKVLESKKKISLSFVKRLTLFIVKPNTNTKLAIVHSKYEKKHENIDSCGDSCYEIDVANLNLVDYIDDKGEITFVPEVEIGKTPKDDFKLKLGVDFEIGMKLDI